MRIPKNITYTNDNSIIEETITFDSFEHLSMPYLEQLDITPKLIKRIERMVRDSLEMRCYIEYLRDELTLQSCTIFQSLDYYDVSIEFHHGPLTLYDITDIVLRKLTSLNLDVTVFDVGEEIVRLHYENKVGLLPLSKTIHQLYHSGELFLPCQLFLGNWKAFYKEYKEYFTDDQIAMLKEYIKNSNEIIKDQQIPDILQRKYDYLIVEGMELPKKINTNKEISI